MSRFREALASGALSAIAELKRRSPSAGDLRPDARIDRLVPAFDRAGASAISILVDERFGGGLEDLRAARASTLVPLLAKGFFRTEEDLRAVRAGGADAVLLILADLEDGLVSRLSNLARELDMDALVEAHDDVELARAVALGADPIGINARDLRTFRIDRVSQLALVTRAPRDRVVVAESGIRSRADAVAAELAGADAILVGTELMRASDPAGRLAELMRRPVVKVCGLTREEDVIAAAEAGADLAGFILAASPRRVPAPLPVPETMLPVVVMVGGGRGRHATADAPSVANQLVQVYPEENGHRGRDGLMFRAGRPVARVVDLPWQGEDPNHWLRAAETGGRLVLAGGLGPQNVADAVRTVRPWCVDACRGLESAPGIKDPGQLRAFVEAVR